MDLRRRRELFISGSNTRRWGRFNLWNKLYQPRIWRNEQIRAWLFNEKIELHGEITPHFNAGTSDCLAHEVLVALVYDKKSEAQRPLNNLIFDWDGGSTYRKSYGIINPLYEDRFKLLWKKIIKIPNYNTTVVTGQTQYPFQRFRFDVKKKYKNGLKTMCANTNNGDYTDINTGAVWLCFCTSENVTADSQGGYARWDSKVVFTDA